MAVTQTPRRGGRNRFAVLLVIPFCVLFFLTTILPIGYAAWMSLYSEQASGGLGFGGTVNLFVGLGNYVEALGEPAFRTSLLHVVSYCLLYIPIMVGGALTLALLIDSAMARARKFFQLMLFLPHAVPGLIASIIWVYLYTPGISPLSNLLNVNFLSPGNALPSMVNMAVWQWMGYNMVIFYAALQAIPREIIEAVTVDGAGGIRTAWSVKIPMIKNAVILTMLFTCIGAIQLFTEPQILADASPTMTGAWSPVMYIYQAAFVRHDYGLAAASSLLLAALAASLSFIVTRLGNRWRAA